MRSAQVLRVVAMISAAAAMVAGCGGSSDPGSAEPSARDLDKIIVFNVCSQLSEDVLRQAGLDPATKRTTTDPPTGVSAWRVCSWEPIGNDRRNSPRSVGVFSSSRTLEEARSKESLVEVHDAKVNSRTALTFREGADPMSCYAAFGAEQGHFAINVAWLSEKQANQGDLCAMALQYATALEPSLPR